MVPTVYGADGVAGEPGALQVLDRLRPAGVLTRQPDSRAAIEFKLAAARAEAELGRSNRQLVAITAEESGE